MVMVYMFADKVKAITLLVQSSQSESINN